MVKYLNELDLSVEKNWVFKIYLRGIKMTAVAIFGQS